MAKHSFFVNVETSEIASIAVWRMLKARKKDGKNAPPKLVAIDFDDWDIATFGEVQVRETLGGAGEGKVARYRVQALNEAKQVLGTDVIRVEGAKRAVPVSKRHLAVYGFEPGTESQSGFVFIRGLPPELQFAFAQAQMTLSYFKRAHNSLEDSVIKLMQRFSAQPMHGDLITELQRERTTRDRLIEDLTKKVGALEAEKKVADERAARKGGGWSKLGEAMADRLPNLADKVGARLEKLADELEPIVKSALSENGAEGNGAS